MRVFFAQVFNDFLLRLVGFLSPLVDLVSFFFLLAICRGAPHLTGSTFLFPLFSTLPPPTALLFCDFQDQAKTFLLASLSRKGLFGPKPRRLKVFPPILLLPPQAPLIFRDDFIVALGPQPHHF